MKVLVLLVLMTARLAAAEPVTVTAQPADRLEQAQLLHAPAQVLSLNESRIASEVEAVVFAVHADVGHRARAGELLVTLDATDLALVAERIEADIASTAARLEQARLRLARARDLGEGQFVSADDMVARETEVSVLRAELRRQRLELRSARRDIDKCRITAPFDGAVTERWAQVGSLLRRGDPVVTLVDTGRFELDALIPDRHRESLPQAPEWTFAAGQDTWTVILERLSPVVEAGQRVSRARFRFGAAAPAIGTSGELRWRTRATFLPASLLVQRDAALGVFVVDDGSARFVALPQAQAGRPAPHRLAPGTLVVVDGRERLQPGDAIRVADR